MKKNMFLDYISTYNLLLERKRQLEAAKKQLITASKSISQDNPSFEEIKAIMDAEKLVKDMNYFVDREGNYLSSLEKEIIFWLRNYNKPKSIYIPAQYTKTGNIILYINYEDWQITLSTQIVGQN